MTSWTLPSHSMAKPVWRQAMTSEWSPKMFSAWVDTVRADTWNTQGSCSAAILYILGIISSRPWDAVYVVVRAPAPREPWTAPAAPASDCISTTLTLVPKMFFRPLALHWSTKSAMGLDGVMG